jgi:hypothetical protein
MTNNTMIDNTERDNPSAIEEAVMRRVRRVYWLRLVTSNVTAAGLLLALALWAIGREVWVAKVFANGPQDLVGRALYFGYAFMHTHVLVQALTVVTVLSTIYLARELARRSVALTLPRTV